MFPPGRGKLANRPVQLWVFHQAENGLTTLPVLRYRFNHRNRKCRLKNLSYWNKEAVDLAVAVSRLRQLKQSEADPKVFINGDATAPEPEPPPPPVVRPSPRHVPIAKTPPVEGIPNPKPSQAQPLPPEPPSLPAAKPQDSMASGPVSSTPPGPGDMVSPIPATGGGLGPGSSTGQANYRASDTGTTLASKGNASFTSAAPDYLHDPPPEYPEEASGDANPLADETHAGAVPAYQPRHYPFDGGEKAVYHASWNGILSMATAEIRTTPQWIDGKKFYSVRVEARTSKLLDLIWKMRDTITSTIEAEELMPTRFTFSQRENQKVIDTVAHFDRATKKWSVHRDEKGKVKQYEFDQPTNTVDPITAIYLARSQDFKVGDHLFFHIFG